jgi:hypothetical protein
MNAYIYCADIYCQQCGEQAKRALDGTGVKDNGDSNRYPQGPYPDGGGEADTPQHCGDCLEFLENPLTGDGYNYVADRFDEYRERGRGSKPTLEVWAEFYNGENETLNDAITRFQESK